MYHEDLILEGKFIEDDVATTSCTDTDYQDLASTVYCQIESMTHAH
jgi:hypothetical protein